MAVKYIKDHKTQETVYPITKSECIIDAHSINNYEIDLIFDGSPEYESSDSGIDYLNYNGLKHYHKKISEEVKTDLENVQVDLTGYATEQWVELQNYLKEHQDISHLATKDEVTNIDFYNIKDNPIVNNGDGKLLFVDENGYIGLQLEENGLYVKDVIADGHTLSQKADKSELSKYATKDELAQKQDVISDIDTIRSNAANYKGTVTSVKINGQSKSPSSGVVDLGYINKQLSTSTSSSMALSPNIYYRNTSTALSTLTITLDSVSNNNIINEYFVEFTTSSSGTTVSLPSTIKWANGEIPTFEASTTYQISIVNNLGVVTKFE